MKRRIFFFSVIVSIFLSLTGQQVIGDADQNFTGWLSLLLSPRLDVTKLIVAEEGGEVILPNGISITIPPDALDEDTRISLGEVNMTRYDGDVTVMGGVNGLHVASAIFEPNGTVLNTPAVIRFPLPADWDVETKLALSVANGSNPFNLLPSVEPVTVSGSPGNYTAEADIFHFTVYGISRWCHSGTYRTVVKQFEDAGCTDEQIKQAVTKKYPGFTIDAKQAEKTDENHIQAFLGTFFEEYPGGTYGKDNVVPQATIDALKAAVLSGRQVVVAFNLTENWPQTKNSDGFYTSFPHTATLVKGPYDSIMVHHVISQGAYKEAELKRLFNDYKIKFPDYEETIFYQESFSESTFQNFRQSQVGAGFKNFVQAVFGKWVSGVWVPDYDDDFFTISIKKYHSVKVYIEKRTNTSVSPCYEEPCDSRGLSGPEVVAWGEYQWQRCDDGSSYNYNDSVVYCENLVAGGYSDWRIPNLAELKSLVVCTNGCPVPLNNPQVDPYYCGDDSCSGDYARPTINPSFQCHNSSYWTSASAYGERMWTVWFGDGGMAEVHPDSSAYVRCVRD